MAAWRIGTWIARGGVLWWPSDVTSTTGDRSRARFQPVISGSTASANSTETTRGGDGGCQ